MWAHAEYTKLLRSVLDRQIFDLIPEVAARYQTRMACKALEVWKPNRQVRSVTSGMRLRVQAPRPFRLHWSRDEWQTVEDTVASATALDIAFVDIPVPATQHAPIRFTFLWTDSNRWEGRDYEVAVAR
jgi:glucoamylase